MEICTEGEMHAVHMFAHVLVSVSAFTLNAAHNLFLDAFIRSPSCLHSHEGISPRRTPQKKLLSHSDPESLQANQQLEAKLPCKIN